MGVRLVPIGLLDPCRFQKPHHADEENIEAIRRDLEENGGLLLNPIHVIPKGKRWEIIAGHDRVEAARRAGLDEVGIRSFLHVLGPADDEAVWRHWKRDNALRKVLNKRDDVEETLGQWPAWSNGKIAADIGCSAEYVRQIRTELEDAGRLQVVATIEGRDGVERPARKPSPPKGRSDPDDDMQLVASREAPSPIPKVPPTKAPKYDKLASMRAAREAQAEEPGVIPLKREPATEDEWVADETRKAKREVEESPWGRITSWLMRLPLPDKWTDEQVRAAVAKDIPNGCMTSARIVHAVLGRIIEEADREESSASA